MARRYYSSTAQQTTLAADATNVTTTMVVAAAVGLPATYPYTMIIDADTVNEEVVSVTNRSGTTLTVTRGQDGTSGVAHSTGAVVKHGVSARDFDEPNAFINEGGTVGGGVTLSSGNLAVSAGTITASSTISASGLAGSLLSSATPAALGTAAQGTSAIPSRQDHVHSGTNVALTTPTITGATETSSVLIAPEERWNISATAIAASTTVDYLTAQNWSYTTASTAGACTINIRGNSGTTLASLLAVGDSVTFTFAVTTGASTPGYFNAVNIDGTATGVTVRWQYGTTPAAGTTSGVDMYSFTVVKTAGTPTYTVFASVVKW